MQPSSGTKPVNSGPENFVNPNKTHSNKQNSGWLSKVDWPSYGAGLATGVLTTAGYYALNNPTTEPKNIFSPSTPDTTSYVPHMITGLFVTALSLVAWYNKKNSSIPVSEEKPQQITNSNSEKTREVTETKPKNPKVILQEWWELAEGFETDSGMPTLSEDDIQILYNCLKDTENSISNSIVTLKEWSQDVLEVKCEHQRELISNNVCINLGGQKLPLNQDRFNRFVGGCLLSQKTRYFAVANSHGRGGFLVYKNINGKIGKGGLIGEDWGVDICTREGWFAPSTAVWKIRNDGICYFDHKVELTEEERQQRRSTFKRTDINGNIANISVDDRPKRLGEEKKAASSNTNNINNTNDANPEEEAVEIEKCCPRISNLLNG